MSLKDVAVLPNRIMTKAFHPEDLRKLPRQAGTGDGALVVRMERRARALSAMSVGLGMASRSKRPGATGNEVAEVRKEAANEVSAATGEDAEAVANMADRVSA